MKNDTVTRFFFYDEVEKVVHECVQRSDNADKKIEVETSTNDGTGDESKEVPTTTS